VRAQLVLAQRASGFFNQHFFDESIVDAARQSAGEGARQRGAAYVRRALDGAADVQEWPIIEDSRAALRT
jgi:hypothetical protein